MWKISPNLMLVILEMTLLFLSAAMIEGNSTDCFLLSEAQAYLQGRLNAEARKKYDNYSEVVERKMVELREH